MAEPLSVSIVADPGFTTTVTERALHLGRDAEAVADGGERRVPGVRSADPALADYDFRLSRRTVPLRENGALMLSRVRSWARENIGGDVLVVITEVPRRRGRRPKVWEVFPEDRVIVVSLPALGAIRLVRRLRDTVLEALAALEEDSPDRVARRGEDLEHGSARSVADESPAEGALVAFSRRRPARLLLVAGMVRSNRPFHSFARLSGCLAAATATAGFGVFYSSVWQMAQALSPWRLGLVSLVVVFAMVLWLVVRNGFWDRGGLLGGRVEAAMYNASTVVTLLLGVVTLYLTLYLGILLASFAVIEIEFLSQTIGEEAGSGAYFRIAWLSASLGTFAGGLGSNFDSGTDIGRLTHGRRLAARVLSDDTDEW
ncbi:hypothetical protein [Brevibacterium samyangense]|uniref:Uncharacterized protein n=1 Tax=Brevibacterium samyangense TaxID=366888 RepID=A0ABP5F380_9MICO